MKAKRCHACGRAITWGNLVSWYLGGGPKAQTRYGPPMVAGCWTCAEQDGIR